MKDIAVRWTMSCDVNDCQFDFNGEGVGQPEKGLLAMQFRSTGFPAGFDPVSCPCICNAPMSIGFSGCSLQANPLWKVAGDGFSVFPARIGVIHDAKGQELLRLSITSVVSKQNGSELVIGNHMTGFSRLPKLLRHLTPIEEYLIPVQPGEAYSVTRFKLLSVDNEVLTGTTTVPYHWEGKGSLDKVYVRKYDSIDVQWNGGRAVSSEIRSSLIAIGSTSLYTNGGVMAIQKQAMHLDTCLDPA